MYYLFPNAHRRMKILKKEGVVEKRGEGETKSILHAPVSIWE
jgi:hypothetical protein